MMKTQAISQYFQNKLKFVTWNRFVIPSLFAVTLLRFRNLGHRTIRHWD